MPLTRCLPDLRRPSVSRSACIAGRVTACTTKGAGDSTERSCWAHNALRWMRLLPYAEAHRRESRPCAACVRDAIRRSSAGSRHRSMCEEKRFVADFSAVVRHNRPFLASLQAGGSAVVAAASPCGNLLRQVFQRRRAMLMWHYASRRCLLLLMAILTPFACRPRGGRSLADPRKEPVKCGRTTASYVCDPDRCSVSGMLPFSTGMLLCSTPCPEPLVKESRAPGLHLRESVMMCARRVQSPGSSSRGSDRPARAADKGSGKRHRDSRHEAGARI